MYSPLQSQVDGYFKGIVDNRGSESIRLAAGANQVVRFFRWRDGCALVRRQHAVVHQYAVDPPQLAARDIDADGDLPVLPVAAQFTDQPVFSVVITEFTSIHLLHVPDIEIQETPVFRVRFTDRQVDL